MTTASICDERGPGGFSWTMREAMGRSSHALVADRRIWLVDPIDEPIAMSRLAELGTPVAVVQLLDRHDRDCAAVAARLDVPHIVCPTEIPDSPFEVIRLTWRPWWREVALWWEDSRVLVVAEAVGTTEFFTAGVGAVGVHALLRPFPPKDLLAADPHHLLVGHGRGVRGETVADEVRRAIARSRRDIPALLRALPRLRNRS